MLNYKRSFFIVYGILLFICYSSTVETDNHEVKPEKKQELSPVDIYRSLLRKKRSAHREAVGTILQLGDNYEKQYKMVKLLLEKIFLVIGKHKVQVMEMGFVPGDSFPEDEKVRDVVSGIAENTAFLGDIALRLPDITHDIIQRNKEWDMVIHWSIGFCNDTNLYEEKDNKMLQLMAQELNVIPKDPNFTNPYKEEEPIEQVIDKEIDKLLKERLKKEQKKKKKKEKIRGPKLGGGRVEL